MMLYSVCYIGCRVTSTIDVAGWQQECTKPDAQLEVNGLRAEIAYIAQPIDCSGTIIPAYMDINDARWDEDPRVQHWRRETQLGRMPRREAPKTVHPAVLAGPSVPRDPRLKSDVQPASAVSQLQQQQQHIEQMVQHLMQRGTPAMTTGAGLPVAGTLTTSAPLSAVDFGIGTSQVPQVLQPSSSVDLTLGTSVQQSVQLPLVSVDSPVSVIASRHDAVVSSDGEVPSKSVSSTTSDAQEPFKVPVPAPLSSTEIPSSAVIKNKADTNSADQKESNSAGEQRKLDYHNNPRFKKRKSKSSNAMQDSNKSALPVSSYKPSTCESARMETSLQGMDVMQFQSPLAVTDNTRLSTATSGYNRPPNKRYQQLLEQGNQQPSRERYTASSDPRRKPISGNSEQLTKTGSAHSMLQAVVTFPGVVSQDMLSCDSLAKGSLKDMFKTIDPTASPFC